MRSTVETQNLASLLVGYRGGATHAAILDGYRGDPSLALRISLIDAKSCVYQGYGLVGGVVACCWQMLVLLGFAGRSGSKPLQNLVALVFANNNFNGAHDHQGQKGEFDS